MAFASKWSQACGLPAGKVPENIMAYDEFLGEKIRRAIGKRAGLSEKKMFGGVAFMLKGNLCCGIHANELIARIDPEDAASALSEPGAHPFDITGRPMKGWVSVKPAALTDAAVGKWVRRSLAYVKTLPMK
jgi:hypothetical protein